MFDDAADIDLELALLKAEPLKALQSLQSKLPQLAPQLRRQRHLLCPLCCSGTCGTKFALHVLRLHISPHLLGSYRLEAIALRLEAIDRILSLSVSESSSKFSSFLSCCGSAFLS